VRAIGVAIITLVLIGWFAIQYPTVLRLAGGRAVTFAQAAAPESTLRALLFALVAGSAVIFPALFYLLKVFKWETLESK
jgi:cytochrome d ubiquinol oxidase subunit II